jgi:peptide/nickel transport system permease protein
MLRYLAQRLLVGVVVILLVATAVFFITRVISNPALAFLPIDASREQRHDVLHYLGLDQSLGGQYWRFLVQLAHLNLGTSFWQQGKPAADIVFTRLPMTLYLDIVAIVLSVAIAIPLGVIAALRPGSKLDKTTTTASLIGLSIPEFWLSFMLVLIFGVKLGWFPTSGAREPASVVLPALALALPTSGKITQLMRSSMIDELDQPYMLTAEAKGMPARYRITQHALRNCLVPVFTQSSFEFARMIAGYTVVVEVVFAWPGVGQLIVQALQNQDLVLLQAIVVILAALIVLINLLTDMLYTVIDPRIEVS